MDNTYESFTIDLLLLDTIYHNFRTTYSDTLGDMLDDLLFEEGEKFLDRKHLILGYRELSLNITCCVVHQGFHITSCFVHHRVVSILYELPFI